MNTRKTLTEIAAGKISLELPADEGRQRTVFSITHGQESLVVLPDDLVQNGRLGLPATVVLDQGNDVRSDTRIGDEGRLHGATLQAQPDPPPWTAQDKVRTPGQRRPR